MSDKPVIKGVIFDIDGTLSPVVSWLELTTSLGASVEGHNQIFDKLRSGQITPEESRVKLIELWHATGRADRQQLSSIFLNWPMDPFVDQVMTDIRNRGATICLITSSFNQYAEIVAHRLNVTHWYANTHLMFAPTGELISYEVEAEPKMAKLEAFEQFLGATGLKPTDCAVIGDDLNDVELFRATGHGIFIDHTLGTQNLDEVRSAAWQSVPDLLAAGEVLNTVLPSS